MVFTSTGQSMVGLIVHLVRGFEMKEIEIVKWGVLHNVLGKDMFAYETPTKLESMRAALARCPSQEFHGDVKLTIIGGHTEKVGGFPVVELLAEEHGFDYLDKHQGLYFTLTVKGSTKNFDLYSFCAESLYTLGGYLAELYSTRSLEEAWEVEISKGNLIYFRWNKDGCKRTRWAAEDLPEVGKATPLPNTENTTAPIKKYRITLITPCGKAVAQSISAGHYETFLTSKGTTVKFWKVPPETTREKLLSEDSDVSVSELEPELRAQLRPKDFVSQVAIPSAWAYQLTEVAE
jgi:hypothetical protein